jgi:hypothetical protein
MLTSAIADSLFPDEIETEDESFDTLADAQRQLGF